MTIKVNQLNGVKIVNPITSDSIDITFMSFPQAVTGALDLRRINNALTVTRDELTVTVFYEEGITVDYSR